jgi:Zn-dependent M28 family amino/carboxypeptidase
VVSTGCTKNLPQFDGERAYQYLVKQVDFGPRYPGSGGHAEALKYLVDELSKVADRVNTQEFSIANYRLPITNNDSLTLTNVIASFDLEKGNRILLSSHWDTRPWADQDPDPENQDKPILGANDGASGVACLLELAHVLKNQNSKYGVDIVLFDGEDLGASELRKEGVDPDPELDSGDSGRPYGGYLMGSNHFARNLRGYRPQFGINIDMVGDRELDIYIDGNSNNFAPVLVEQVFKKAAGIPQIHPEVRYFITDDHIPLNQAGIPTLLLIDFDYPYWHTLEDTPDKCSPESLQAVGDLLVRILYD